MTEEDEEFQRLEREVEMRRMVVRRMAEEDDDTQVYKKPWVGLTEAEKSDLWWADQMTCQEREDLIRDIEAKLKAKNT